MPGHCMDENLLVLKTVITRMEQTGEGIIFLSMDINAFFDKEDIFDCLETLERIGVSQKLRRLWFLMNNNTRVSVKTAFGTTDEINVGAIVGQGTAGAALISAINLDKGLNEFFKDGNDIDKYGNIDLQPLAYQDDVGSLCKSVSNVRSQAEKMAKMISSKNLTAHPNKTGVTILGRRN